MTETQIMVLELGSKGYSCAQIIILGALRLMGQDNPDLIRAMGGLAQGVANSGNVCGAFSGASCLISLYTDKGKDTENPLQEKALLQEELLTWFTEELCNHGPITCDAILGCDPNTASSCRIMDKMRCGELVARVWDKTISLLVQYGLDPTHTK